MLIEDRCTDKIFPLVNRVKFAANQTQILSIHQSPLGGDNDRG